MNSYSQWMFTEEQLIHDNQFRLQHNHQQLNRPNPMIHEAEIPRNAGIEKQNICNNINIIGRLMTRLYPVGSFDIDVKGTLTGLKYRICYAHLQYILNKEQLRTELHHIGFNIGKDYGGVLHVHNENRQ